MDKEELEENFQGEIRSAEDGKVLASIQSKDSTTVRNVGDPKELTDCQ